MKIPVPDVQLVTHPSPPEGALQRPWPVPSFPSGEEQSRGGGGGYSPKIPIRVCAAQRGHDFGTPYLERGIHFRDVS